MKRLVGWVGSAVMVLLLLGGCALTIREDFAWSLREMERAQSQGWEPVMQFSNVADVARPWTFSGKVVYRMYFLDPDSVRPLGSELRLSRWIHIERRNGRTEYERYSRVFDCGRPRASVHLPYEVDTSSIRPDELRWFDDGPDTPNAYRDAVCR